MLILIPLQVTAVFFARMVMPFSRSRSFESITRSTRVSLVRKMPAWRSMKSTSVVLPWSTWATMATLRMRSRAIMGGGKRAGVIYALRRTGKGKRPGRHPGRCAMEKVEGLHHVAIRCSDLDAVRGVLPATSWASR